MPELPEVETTRRGIEPHITQQTIQRVIIRNSRLRLPVTPNLGDRCAGQIIVAVKRRAKYLLLALANQTHLLIHLGMSGHLRLVDSSTPLRKHDHIDMLLSNGLVLRYNDPRRFGLWLLLEGCIDHHPLLSNLGPEPLTEAFHTNYLIQKAFRKNRCIKSMIMNNEVVVGVGNIYAAESLYLAGIHPKSVAGNLSHEHLERLTQSIKQILQAAILAGGTTLRDFFTHEGKPGYFTQNLQVYGRTNQPCYQCQQPIQSTVIAGRNSSFCSQCQPAF